METAGLYAALKETHATWCKRGVHPVNSWKCI